jgi:hypothetical protein
VAWLRRALVPRRVEKSETAADPGPVESARSPSIIIVPASMGESRASRRIILHSTNRVSFLRAPVCLSRSSLQSDSMKRPPLHWRHHCPSRSLFALNEKKMFLRIGITSPSELSECFSLAHWCVYATFAIAVRS